MQQIFQQLNLTFKSVYFLKQPQQKNQQNQMRSLNEDLPNNFKMWCDTKISNQTNSFQLLTKQNS